MRYRLALDLGTNSIGWCRLLLDDSNAPQKILDAGVRVFSDGREARGDASLAVTRRLARQARRRRDRYIRRRKRLMNALIRHGLMPENDAARKALELVDPYMLRAKGLRQPLTMHELGRAIFHLNQRRGFKSSRKTASDKDAPKIKPAMQRLRENMADMTYGEYLFLRKLQGLHVRARKTGDGATADYDFYPERSIVEDEFNRLWDAQAVRHVRLTPEAKYEIHNIIFYQRPLKPINPGRCTLEPSETRCPRALPLAQRFRILQELNHLRVVMPDLSSEPLTQDQRDNLLKLLLKRKTITFDQMKKSLGLGSDYSFNLEGEKRDKLQGDETGSLIGGRKGIGTSWHRFSPEDQNHLVHLLLETDDEEDLLGQLTQEWGLNEKEAWKLSAMELPAGYARLSEKALRVIVPELEAEVIPYSEAVKRAGYESHSDLGAKAIWPRLPYYGIILERHVCFGSSNPADRLADQFGRVTNPTVHIALNQVRRIVNELIKLHGHPAQIALEMSRDLKNGPVVRRRIETQQAENQRYNEHLRQKLDELGRSDRGDGVLRLRLWEDLSRDPAARCCPYKGEVISIDRLFSGDVEIDHILPFSRTLDDSIANKTLCMRQANRDKGNRTPHEAFGHSPAGYNWQAIVARAKEMPRNKRWRFAEEAMREFEKDGDFLARQLTDNHYIARLAREYLAAICPASSVWGSPGRLTYLLSRSWGFPEKNRDDHRHHVRDAILVGLTDRALLKRVADTHKRNYQQGFHQFLSSLEPPWPGLREEALSRIENVVVSHRPDHGVQGQLHNDTAYGIAGDNGSRRNAEHRVPAAEINNPGKLLAIKGKRLRAELLCFLCGNTLQECKAVLNKADELPQGKAKKLLKEMLTIDDKKFSEKSMRFFAKRGIRRVRIAETEPLIHVSDHRGRVYKGFKGDSNAYFDIFQSPDGKWVGEIVSTYDANQQNFASRYEGQEGYQRVVRLFKNDMLEIEGRGNRIYAYVVKISAKQIALAPHTEANVDSRSKDRENSFSMIYKSSPAALQKAGAHPVHVTPAGRIFFLEVPEDAGPSGRDSR